MHSRLAATGRWLRARAENVAALLLAAMFCAFLLQIVCRYVFNLPTGWINELSVFCWLWLVPFGAAFIVGEASEIRLDLVYSASPARLRRIMQAICAIALVGLFSISLPAVVDYVTFMKVQKTAYLKVPFDWLFSIYVIFAVAMIVRYIWLGYRAIWGGDPANRDVTERESGV